MFGLSQVRGDAIGIAQDVGGTYLRPTLSSRDVEPAVTIEGLTVDAVRNDPAGISAWSAARSWSGSDQRLDAIHAAGVRPCAHRRPRLHHDAPARRRGEPAAPDILGQEEYLARQYRFTRAVVERYDGDGVDDAPSGLRIPFWQTENELNQAFFTAIFGWRYPDLFGAFGSAWTDWEFVTRILETLRLAVKDADPTALTTMNFHTDVLAGPEPLLRRPGLAGGSRAVARPHRRDLLRRLPELLPVLPARRPRGRRARIRGARVWRAASR